MNENYLAIDYGSRRIGLAHGDDLDCDACPAAAEANEEERLEHIAREIRIRRITKLIVGYPVNMDGSHGYKTREVDAFIGVLEARFSFPSSAWTRRFRATKPNPACRQSAKAETMPVRAKPTENGRNRFTGRHRHFAGLFQFRRDRQHASAVRFLRK